MAGALLVAACGEDVHQVTLTFTVDESGPHGFVCQDQAGRLLAARVFSTQSPHQPGDFSVVVDFFGLDGTPACRAAELITFCSDPTHACPLLGDARACIPGHVDPLTPGDPRAPSDLVAEAFAQLQDGPPFTRSAPDQPVIVRVVATIERCEDLATDGSFSKGGLIGCANSCPVYLPEAGSEVQLDLDVYPPLSCTIAQVAICATTNLKRL